MYRYRRTPEILDMPWEDLTVSITPIATFPWHGDRHIRVEDVEFWETIYYEKGNVGVYVAHRPHCEFYMITINQMLDTPFGIETYRNVSKVISRCKSLGIELKITETKHS